MIFEINFQSDVFKTEIELFSKIVTILLKKYAENKTKTI